MKAGKLYLLIGMCLAMLAPRVGHSCSTFCLAYHDQPLFGKNYDWHIGDGLVMVNKRHVTKTAMGSPDERPARWISSYGSITFNQYGRELPLGGMNEAGLVVELMWLEETEYAAPDARPSIGVLQWVQYQLDTANTIDDVLAIDTHLRIRQGGPARIHYLVCDRTGTCASIELLRGQLVYHTKETLPITTLTNHTYTQSMAFLQQHVGFGGILPLPASTHSLDRFVRAAHLVQQYDPLTGPAAVDYAFDILTNIAQGSFTKWSIVYDIHHRRIHLRTLANPRRRSIDMHMFNFSCATPVQVLDINTDGAGDVTRKFQVYTQQINRQMIGTTFAKTELVAHLSPEVLDGIARYPSTTMCTQ